MDEIAAATFRGARLETVEKRPEVSRQIARCRLGQMELEPGLRRRCASIRLPGRLTSPAMLGELTSPRRVIVPAKGNAPPVSQGLGFGLGTFQGHRWLGHNGGTPGVNVEAMAFPDDRTAVVILSNRDPPAATALLRQVRAALFDPDQAKLCASPH